MSETAKIAFIVIIIVVYILGSWEGVLEVLTFEERK